MPSTPQPSRNRVRPSQLVRRWDALAAEQLRAELEQVANQRDALAARVDELERQLADAEDWAEAELRFRSVYQDQLTELLTTARRAGICLHVRPIGMTRDGQIGLMAGQVAA